MSLRLSLVDRYVLRQLAFTVAGMLVAMMVLIVCVVALQELSIVTNRGAALATFALLTAYSLPSMISVVAPIALFLALLLTLNRLSADSEVVVFNASGGSPMHLFRPILLVALAVSLVVAIIGHLVAPPAQAAWRYLVSDARADLLSSAVREGSFVQIQDGLTFHTRAREPGGVLADIMIADTSAHPEELVYFAQRGTIVRNENGSFLAVEDGVIQRRSVSASGRVSKAFLYFDTYAIDLSFTETGGTPGFLKPSERSTPYLFNPEPNDPFFVARPGRFAAELHNRMALPLYPLAFAAIVTLALGMPHSSRAGRGKRVLGACLAAGAVLGGQFAANSLIVADQRSWPVIYLLPLAVLGVSLVLLTRRLDGKAIADWTDRLVDAAAQARRGVVRRLAGAREG